MTTSPLASPSPRSTARSRNTAEVQDGDQQAGESPSSVIRHSARPGEDADTDRENVDVPRTQPPTIDLQIFAAMPFELGFDDVYFIGMRAAANAIGARCIRVDQLLHGGDAVAETQRQIRASDAVVADVTAGEPDVMYEVGYAHALGKPVVQICSTSYLDLPFTLRNRDTLLYKVGRTHLLAEHLTVYLRRLLGGQLS